MKRCSKCGEEKERSAFNARAAKKDGLRSQCRECDRADERRRIVDPEKKRQADKAYRGRLKEDSVRLTRARETKRRYRKRRPDEHRAYSKRAYRKDIEKSRKAKRERAARTYSENAFGAAIKRARTILAREMPIALIGRDLLEAKAAQLLVRRFIRKGE